jgi:hypothetical protein
MVGLQESRVGRSTLLHRALQLDAAASGLLGVLLVAASGTVGRLLDLPAVLLLDAGVVMLVWAGVTGWLGTRARAFVVVQAMAVLGLTALQYVGLRLMSDRSQA